ncbi:MAG: glycyl-radical enzyme activating protein [Eubacteriaceae bacterium]|nr:glycyl-radical enzyme activating protein [Eubacteriaceae bacterium]
MKGNIFEIQHFSVNDGPGIRTTVFFKGCQLHCLWCHNPESIDDKPGEFAFVASKCVGCGSCFRICPEGCHSIADGKHIIDREKCTFCGKCVKMCSGSALSIYGDKGMTVEEVMSEVSKDRSYYDESGGGITLSGGEPMMQSGFVRELAEAACAVGISVAIETNACCKYSYLDDVKNYIDLFLVDWKASDPAKHKEYTGMSNEIIYENLCRLNDSGKKVLLRCPIIPGYNDNEDHFRKIAEITKRLDKSIGAELLPYHSMGVGKIEKFGLEDRVRYIVAKPPAKETVEEWVRKCRSYGGRMVNE